MEYQKGLLNFVWVLRPKFSFKARRWRTLILAVVKNLRPELTFGGIRLELYIHILDTITAKARVIKYYK